MRAWVALFASNIGGAGVAFIVSHTLRTLVDTPPARYATAWEFAPASATHARFCEPKTFALGRQLIRLQAFVIPCWFLCVGAPAT